MGEYIDSATPTDYGDLLIDVDELITDTDDDLDPDPDQPTFEKIRYTIYSNNGQYYYNQDMYLDTADDNVISAKYELNQNDIPVFYVGRFGESNIYNQYIDPNNFGNTDDSFVGFKIRSRSKGKTNSGGLDVGIYDAGVNGSKSEARTEVLSEYIDLNGDRYPDFVTKTKIQFSSMKGGLSNNIKTQENISELNSNFFRGSSNKDQFHGASISSSTFTSNNQGSSNIDNPNIPNIEASFGLTEGYTESIQQWLDINGDGLTDRVEIIPQTDAVIDQTTTSIEVQLNTEYGFSKKINWADQLSSIPTTPYISERESDNSGIGDGFNTSQTTSFSFGIGGSVNTSTSRIKLVDVNGDALPDLLLDNGTYYINNGTNFDANPKSFYNDATDVNKSSSLTLNGSYTSGTAFWVVWIPVKVTGTVLATTSISKNHIAVSLRDINGDGYVDVIHDTSSGMNLNVNLSKIKKTHLLKKVTTPFGGSWEVSYARAGNTSSLPQNKWVLDEVTTFDGYPGDNDLSVDETKQTFEYSNPFYDRHEREFYGFEILRINSFIKENQSDQWTLYNYTLKKIHNDNFYLKGKINDVSSFTSQDQPLSQTQYFYKAFDHNTSTDGSSSTPTLNTDPNDNLDLSLSNQEKYSGFLWLYLKEYP
ncbi:toxin TcdB middle/N-terminal domain-containing protein [Flavobacterium sp. CS20]|uniref:toxin TcdB middle/N-terminal domain-containing protein n=1 Tax=Flavobacterium sp. CS20 TaxID=2775246 RepID=UPI001B3A3BAF|nr:toxin TcdB middle/N-terminal domain-containing protein [Flavobacterium sp. CS20]QTY27560.1 hypothetical protein IGB25_03140 [Flavobacterium sp. CS20]